MLLATIVLSLSPPNGLLNDGVVYLQPMTSPGSLAAHKDQLCVIVFHIFPQAIVEGCSLEVGFEVIWLGLAPGLARPELLECLYTSFI
jgi:hypothetical protein